MEAITLKEIWANGVVYYIQHFQGQRDSIELISADPEASYLVYKFHTEHLSDGEYNNYMNLVVKLNSFFFADEANSCVWFWNHISSKLVVVSYPSNILAEGRVIYNDKLLEGDFNSFNHISLAKIQVHSKNVATLTYLNMGRPFEINVRYDENKNLWS
jgi:hypothetical protein